VAIYSFTVVLADRNEVTLDLAEALAECTRDEGAARASGGVVYVDFDRESDSWEMALRSAIAEVQTAGCRALRVEIEPGAVVQE
jgi:hypothetical protein